MSYASAVALKSEMHEHRVNPVPPGWIKLYKHPVTSRACADYGPAVPATSVHRPTNSLLKRFVDEERHREDMNRRYGEVSPYWNVRSYLDILTESESESECEMEEEEEEEFDELYDEI